MERLSELAHVARRRASRRPEVHNLLLLLLVQCSPSFPASLLLVRARHLIPIRLQLAQGHRVHILDVEAPRFLNDEEILLPMVQLPPEESHREVFFEAQAA